MNNQNTFWLHFLQAFESNEMAIALFGEDRSFVKSNRIFLHGLGYSESESHSLQFNEHLHPSHQESFHYQFEQLQKGCTKVTWQERLYLTRQGSQVWKMDYLVPFSIDFSPPVGFLLMQEELASPYGKCRASDGGRRSECRIFHLAYHDGLTGLPNRYLLWDRLELAIAHAKRTNGLVALLFLDLDLFKDVNDRFGHLVGDQALKKIAARFASVVREADTIARLGGDEFVIMVTDISGAEDAEIVASKLLETLSEPFHIQGNQIKVNASIGISLFPDNGISAEELLGAADQAMYAVKQHGGGNVSLSDRGLKGSPAGGA